jgi:2-methylisocitrate lyase-like PEP mutase family enzyme
LNPSSSPPKTGILIEDQTWPKSCGHVRNKRVVSREEAVSRIRAAVDAR